MLFEVNVIDTDAQPYLHQPPTSILLTAKIEKNRKYLDVSAAWRAHFCFSVDGLASPQATNFLKRLAYCLSAWWDRSYADRFMLVWALQS